MDGNQFIPGFLYLLSVFSREVEGLCCEWSKVLSLHCFQRVREEKIYSLNMSTLLQKNASGTYTHVGH